MQSGVTGMAAYAVCPYVVQSVMAVVVTANSRDLVNGMVTDAFAMLSHELSFGRATSAIWKTPPLTRIIVVGVTIPTIQFGFPMRIFEIIAKVFMIPLYVPYHEAV